jgi:hypothetical protein
MRVDLRVSSSIVAANDFRMLARVADEHVWLRKKHLG